MVIIQYLFKPDPFLLLGDIFNGTPRPPCPQRPPSCSRSVTHSHPQKSGILCFVMNFSRESAHLFDGVIFDQTPSRCACSHVTLSLLRMAGHIARSLWFVIVIPQALQPDMTICVQLEIPTAEWLIRSRRCLLRSASPLSPPKKSQFMSRKAWKFFSFRVIMSSDTDCRE